MMSVKSLVVIPTYNEKENIRPLLEQILGLEEDFDLLVVDDASPDGTQEVVKELMAKAPTRLFLLARKGKQGLGSAYVEGFGWALEKKYAYVLQMDADFSHDPADLPRLLAPCVGGEADMVIGSRYLKGVNVINWSISRVLLSYAANRYVRLLTGLPVADATAGFACYTARALASFSLPSLAFKGYAFQIGIKHSVWKHGGRIKECSVIFRDRAHGKSKLSMGVFGEAFFGVMRLALEAKIRRYPSMHEPSHVPSHASSSGTQKKQ